MRHEIGMLAAAALALSACGLLEPQGPPARTVGPVPGAPPPDAPLPRPQDPAAPPQDPSAPGEPVPDPPFPGYTLAWRDEFAGTAMDDSKWVVNSGDWKGGVRGPEALVLGGGVLTFVTFTDENGVHHAGHITTGDKFKARYGYYEARARFGDSYGQWCSFFLWPDNYGNPIGDPGNAGVEVDIYEHREIDGSGWMMPNYVQVGINWDGFGKEWKKVNRTVADPDGSPLKGEWHTYSLLWTRDGYSFYIDEKPVFQTSAAVSNVSQNIYLTCEVLDHSWAGDVPAGGYGSRDTSTTRMDIDWVRVWVPSDEAAR